MLQAWIGDSRQMSMRWGDASDTLVDFQADVASQRNISCDLSFYDGPHDVLSALKMVMMLRRVASRRKPWILVDEVGCRRPMCQHSTLAWDFMVWAGFIMPLRCVEDPELDYGTCLGRFLFGPRAASCALFNPRCIAEAFGTQQDDPKRGEIWASCCTVTT